MRRECRTAIRYGVILLALSGASLQSQAADVVTSVQQVLSNPSAFHRHDVVLKGRLMLVGQWEGKDTVGRPICGPIFKLDDDTGEIPVLYLIRCDQQEVSRISAMAGGKTIIHATIDSVTVTMNPDGSDYHLRAMATKIQREDKWSSPQQGGQDTVIDNSGTSDTMQFGMTINPLDLVISRQANDLRLTIHGSTDQMTIQNWYSGATNQAETIQAGNGQMLLSTQVDQLIQAMAGFTQQTGLTWDQAIDQQPTQVQTILAASWQ